MAFRSASRLLGVGLRGGLDSGEVGVEAVQGRVPEAPEAIDPVGCLAKRGRFEVAGARHLPDRVREIGAACSSTFRSRDTAGIDIGRWR